MPIDSLNPIITSSVAEGSIFSQSGILIESLIHLAKAKAQIIFDSNTFMNNGGTKGPLVL